ncbi:MAG: prepilin-type N-terminal cleavage/methylation domain-containing protein [Fimbriimonadales bacterium]|nr:prepilin-type N-terminal cleavage/methylation domain-containing protein [Fimbriimonadales bacterium]
MVGMGRHRRGASLVEVLVVIGILAIAILAFIRLYPSGFLALKRSGQSDTATRLAQQEIERLKARSANLPHTIAPIVYDFSTGDPLLLVDPTLDPNDLGTQPNLPQDFPAYLASGVNRFRYIAGERAILGLPGPALGASDRYTEGIVYTALFAPIAQPPPTADEQQRRRYLTVTGPPMRRLILDSEYQRPNIEIYEYGIDYDAGKVLLRPLRGGSITYQVEFSFTYVAPSNRVETRFAVAIYQLGPTEPNPPTPQWYDLYIQNEQGGQTPVRELPGFLGVAPFSDTAARVFEERALGSQWSPNNPYEYQVLNPLTGTILINPNASGYYERYWRGVRPLEAYLSYYVHDWTILREEFTVPDNGRIRLAFADLKRVGDLQDDQTEYAGLGLGRDASGNPLQTDLIVVDMLTGRTAYFRQGSQLGATELAQELRNQILPDLRASVDYAAGVLQINNPDMRGRKIRVFYKVHENWAISVQKAASRYYLAQSPRGLTHDSCWYDIEAAYNGNAQSPVARRLYFTRSEAGKTVLLREYWYVDRDGRRHRGTNGVFRISEIPDPEDGIGLVYIDLRQVHPNAVRWDPSVTGQAMRGIQGLSVKVRVTHEPPGRRPRIDFDMLLPARD